MRSYNTVHYYVDGLESREFVKVVDIKPNQGGNWRKYYSLTEIGMAELFAKYPEVWDRIDAIATKNRRIFELGFGLWESYRKLNLLNSIITIIKEANWDFLIFYFLANREVFETMQWGGLLNRTLWEGIQKDLTFFRLWLNAVKTRPKIARVVFKMTLSDYKLHEGLLLAHSGLLFDIGKILPAHVHSALLNHVGIA